MLTAHNAPPEEHLTYCTQSILTPFTKAYLLQNIPSLINYISVKIFFQET